MGRGDLDVLGIQDGGFKVYEEAFTIFGNVPQREAVDSELTFIGGGTEGEPGGGSDREAFIESGSEYIEEGGVGRGGSGGGGSKEGDSANREKGNPPPFIYSLRLHDTLIIHKETSRIHQFIQDHSRIRDRKSY